MSDKKYYVKNASVMMGSYNLPTKGNKNKPLSLILARGETSRALLEAEYLATEVQRGLQRRDLINVTAMMNR